MDKVERGGELDRRAGQLRMNGLDVPHQNPEGHADVLTGVAVEPVLFMNIVLMPDKAGVGTAEEIHAAKAANLGQWTIPGGSVIVLLWLQR